MTADLDTLDRDLSGNDGGDPAAALALRQPLMVDPALSESANARAVRPPPAIDTGAMPTDELGRPADMSRAADLHPAPAAAAGCA